MTIGQAKLEVDRNPAGVTLGRIRALRMERPGPEV
jgi:hypothetical protein